MKTSDSGKNCECGHTQQDHAIIQKSMTKLAVLERGFFIPTQLDNGICKKCTCPKYYPPRLFRKKREIEYRAKPMNVLDDSENRCTRCGTLYENHDKMDHSFQYRK